jgi:hypothetical protein
MLVTETGTVDCWTILNTRLCPLRIKMAYDILQVSLMGSHMTPMGFLMTVSHTALTGIHFR